jgi:NTE family protein
VAACIERAAEHWFSTGPLVDAILASSAVPGLFPVVEVGGEHYMDGGIVNSIPVERACELGAQEIYVLHAGRIQQSLAPPRNLYQALTVAFEVARRCRFAHDIANLPAGVITHVLPSGEQPAITPGLRGWSFGEVDNRIRIAHAATSGYLDGLARQRAP